MAYERVNWENLPSTNTPINQTNLNKMDEGIANAVNLIYPVGSIYMSVNSTNPANLFGGTWEQIKDRFLLSCGNTYTNGAIGGEATHTLTIDEMPKHNHDITTFGDNNAIWTKQGTTAGGIGVSCINDWGNGLHIENTGGGQPHNNMPPYLAVYMWKRTA